MTKAECRERRLGEAFANIRLPSPEFNSADNLSRDDLCNQARTTRVSFNSGEIAKDDNLQSD